MINKSNTTLLQEIYILNKVLRKYKINFYYTIKKDGIFILNGWIAKERLNLAYTLSAIGAILFGFTFFYYDSISKNNFLFILFQSLSIISLTAGLFILFDFYSKLKNLKTTTLITRNGVSFRNNNVIEFWNINQIKNIEVVFTTSKKNAMKLVSEEIKLNKEGKLIIFNHLGQSKEIIAISNKNRTDLKVDLDSVKSTLVKFMNYSNEQKVENENESIFQFN